jgi:hypothetical protein
VKQEEASPPVPAGAVHVSSIALQQSAGMIGPPRLSSGVELGTSTAVTPYKAIG